MADSKAREISDCGNKPTTNFPVKIHHISYIGQPTQNYKYMKKE